MDNQENPNISGKQKRSFNIYLKYSGIAFQMMAIILGGLFAGIWTDNHFVLKFPVFTLSLTILAFALALYLLFKDVK